MAQLSVIKEPDHHITRYLERGFKTWLLHWHREVEIVRVLEGPCTFVVGKKNYAANPGDFIITRSCEPHQFITSPEKKMQICKFNVGLIYNLTKHFQYPQAHIPYEQIIKVPGLYEELCSVFKKIGMIYNHNASDVLSDCYTALLFCLLAEHFPCNTELAIYDSECLINLQTILDYVDLNYSKPINLQTLAEMINYSDSYVSLLFSRYSGMSYKEYIDRTRISHAAEYIRNGRKTFTEISSLCGYDTVRTFNNVFRRIMNCTPSEYKKAQNAYNYSGIDKYQC